MDDKEHPPELPEPPEPEVITEQLKQIKKHSLSFKLPKPLEDRLTDEEKPVDISELRARYFELPEGSKKKETIAADLRNFAAVDADAKDALEACRAQDDTPAYVASLRDIGYAVRMPLRGGAGGGEEGEEGEGRERARVKIESSFRVGMDVLRRLGASPDMLQRLAKIPILVSSAAESKRSAKEILQMTEDELLDWEEDCGAASESESSGESSERGEEGDSEETSSSLSESSVSSENGGIFDSGPTEQEISNAFLEVGLQFSVSKISKKRTLERGGEQNEPKRTYTPWSTAEMDVIMKTLETAASSSSSSWKDMIGSRQHSLFTQVHEALQKAGYERTYDAVAGKVRYLSLRK